MKPLQLDIIIVVVITESASSTEDKQLAAADTCEKDKQVMHCYSLFK